MSDIDLIPESYRRRLQLHLWLRNFLLVYSALIFCILGGKVLLSYNIKQETAAIEKLRLDKAAVLARKAQLDSLKKEKKHLQERLAVLNKLRRGPPVEDIFVAIDQALDGRVWFLNYKFLRAGEFVDVKPQAVNAGYFIVVPEDAAQNEKKAWRVQAHMEIRAQAVSHSALADFVARLSQQPVVVDVKILNTRTQESNSAQIVDFELAVIISSQYLQT